MIKDHLHLDFVVGSEKGKFIPYMSEHKTVPTKDEMGKV